MWFVSFVSFISAAAILAIIGKESGITAGMLGLSVSYSLNVSSNCKSLKKFSTIWSSDYFHVKHVCATNQRSWDKCCIGRENWWIQ